MQEGLFHADNLAARYPEGFATLKEFVRRNPRANVDPKAADAAWRLRLVSRSIFADRQFWPAAWRLRAAVVCFNFGFDIARLAVTAGEHRRRRKETSTPFGRDAFLGGFSFALWGRQGATRWEDHDFRGRIVVKSIDSKRALKRLRPPERIDPWDLIPEDDETGEPDPNYRFRGHFLDLRTLAFALTDEGHTLESACDAFGVPYQKRTIEHGVITPDAIEYCREDVEATQKLCEATLGEFMRHPIELQPTRAYSPATIGKSYLRAMNVRPILERQPDFPPEILGWAMSAYYGGRAECRIRKTAVPVVYVDFLSMYPTVNALMKTWDLLRATRITAEDATQETQQLLEDLSLEDCFDPAFWPKLPTIVQIAPDGDVLPVRAGYPGPLQWQIGINPFTSSQPLWYTLADAVAAKLLAGKTPTILQAIRFVPHGRERLRATRLRGEVPIDPRRQDPFKIVIEERRRIEEDRTLPDREREWRSKGLKVLANATAYGIYAEMVRDELPQGEKEQVVVYGAGDEPFTAKVAAPEDPGAYCFPPLAAAITGAARLMLALLEHRVTDAGGSYVFCDTDSMAIVASKKGDIVGCVGGQEQSVSGEQAVRALSWAQVGMIVREFEKLNPYDFSGSVLKIEDENYQQIDPETVDYSQQVQLWCYAISAKRYVLFQRSETGEPLLRGWTAVDDADDTDEPDDEPSMRKVSEHGLGHLMSPTDPEDRTRDWIREAWAWILGTELGLTTPAPEWLDRPAIGRTTITTPRVWRLFKRLDKGKEYSATVKPYNFMCIAFVPGLEQPAQGKRLVLVAPYERRSERWEKMDWYDRSTGRKYRVRTRPTGGYATPGRIIIKTYRDIFAEYLGHEESKSLAPDGGPCRRKTTGLLLRRPVTLLSPLRHIGKESNRLDDRNAGLGDLSDIAEYGDVEREQFDTLVRPVLRKMGVREVARRTGFSLGAVSNTISKGVYPHARQRIVYLKVAGEYCAEELTVHDVNVPRAALARLSQFLGLHEGSDAKPRSPG